VTTYAYDPLDQKLRTITDANGQPTHYEYDSMGRLLLTRDSDGNILKTLQYKFKQ
jgi:YD repeat-containing protein